MHPRKMKNSHYDALPDGSPHASRENYALCTTRHNTIPSHPRSYGGVHVACSMKERSYSLRGA
jgi:hypothetical protein